MKKLLFTVAALVAAAQVHAHDDDFRFGGRGGPERDVGRTVEKLLRAQSVPLFGVLSPLDESSALSRSAQELQAHPEKAITVAQGLRVRVVSAAANLGRNADQMVLWPNDRNPTHLIACNEGGMTEAAVQRINLATGAVQDIIKSGLSSCDPVRRTPWGTILVGEETGNLGRLIEILAPLTTTDVAVSDGTTAGRNPLTTTSSDPAHVVFRGAPGTLSWEGIALLPNGVMYMTDENRPGNGNPGGGMFKFIPTNLWVGGAAITNAADSPLAGGRLFGWRAGRNGANTDYGQANEYGRGVWVELTGPAPVDLRAAGRTRKLTHYYRPEDASFDEKLLAQGKVRFCGTNTGQDIPDTESNGDNHWGEVYCLEDGTVQAAAQITTLVQGSDTLNTATVPEYHPLVLGNLDFAMMDNIAYQPGSGNWVLNEDGEGPTYAEPRNNDIWSCLDDGDDAGTLSDGCVKVASLNDLTAESTGGLFDATGRRYFVSIQHNVTGHGIILEITGWR